jgi:SAM-dependent methyltransferase
MKREHPPVERYHDRVAGIYDTIYENNPYWETVFAITWRHVLRYLPKNLATKCLDVGCGTGKWGMQLLKSGYACDFLDISQKMLDQAERKAGAVTANQPPKFFRASLEEMNELPDASYDFIIGQGDPLGSAGEIHRPLNELARVLRPNGQILMSVDNLYGGLLHCMKDGDLDGLETFVKNGRTTWITDEEEQRYPVQSFTPERLRKYCADCGFEIISMIGKTILPLRRFQNQLRDRAARERLIKLEEKLNHQEAALGLAAHLEFVARKK